MKASGNTVTEITLVLNDTEAKWLMTVMQNPLNDYSPINEPPTDRKHRIDLFTALKQALPSGG